MTPTHAPALFVLLTCLLTFAANFATPFPAGPWDVFKNLTDLGRGSPPAPAPALAALRNYFQKFGYLANGTTTNNGTAGGNCTFDGALEAAVRAYQRTLGLNVTGVLDGDTVELLMTPRCGREDAVVAGRNASGRSLYSYFPGSPRWPRGKTDLTYAFDPSGGPPSSVSDADARAAFRRAFSRWATVIPLTFTETDDFGRADLTVGFHLGAHGDGEPFDGVLGTLAHAFSPPDGRFHLDAAETWTVDLEHQRSDVAVDLESIATHEIGHLLGLGHSSDRDAVMYPSIAPRRRKVDLNLDDVQGIQSLYGANPDFNVSLLSYNESASGAGPSPLSVAPLTWLLLPLPLLFLRP